MYNDFCDGEVQSFLWLFDVISSQHPELKTMIDRESVAVALKQTRQVLATLDRVGADVRGELLVFAEHYDRFKQLGLLDVLGRLDLLLKCAQILVGVPLKTNPPSMVASALGMVHNKLGVASMAVQNWSGIWSRITARAPP